MSYSDFLHNTEAIAHYGEYWGEFHITAPDGSAIILRYGKRGIRNGSAQISLNGGTDVIAAHQQWTPRILQVPTITHSMWKEGSILTSSLPTYGQWALRNGDRFLDQYSPKKGYIWAGGKCKLFHFDYTDISGTIIKKFEGKLGQPSYSLAPEVLIPCFGMEEDFNRKTHNRVYRGTSYGLELTGDKTVLFGLSPAQVNLRNDMTVKGWLYLEAVNTNLLVFFGLNGVGPWRLVLSASKQIALFVSVGGASQSVTMSKVLSARIAYHFAVVIIGRDAIFYLWDDANQVLTTETFVNAFTVFTRDTVSGGGIGYQFRSNADPTLKIWGDEFQVFNYAQTKLEIEADRFRPLNSGIPSTCVHRVGFDDGTGTTATDSSLSGLHGAISGAGTHTWLWQMEGGPELAGSPKPDTIGHKFGVKPVLVAPLHYAWQVHWGSTQSIVSSEGGAPRTMSNALTLRDFITTTPAAGNSLTFLGQGLFKLPLGSGVLPVSAIVEGAKDGHLGYVESASRVIRYLAVLRGPKYTDPAMIDTASFTNFEMGFNPSIGFTYYEPKTIKDGMDLAAKSGCAWWGFERHSTQFHLERYTGPALVNDFTYNTRSGVANETLISDISEIITDFVIYGVEVRYHYNDVVMTDEQVAASIKGTSSWTQWTKPYLIKSAIDQTLRDKYEGKGGKLAVFETAIWSDADAQTLANMLLAKLKGEKTGYRVTFTTMMAAEAELGQTEGISYQLGDKEQTVVMSLEGVERYVIITVIDDSQNGKITHEVMP